MGITHDKIVKWDLMKLVPRPRSHRLLKKNNSALCSVHNLKFFVTHQYFKKTLWYRKSILRITEQFNWEEVFEGRTNLRSDLMLMLGVRKPRNTEFLRFNPLVNHQCFGYSINISLTQRHPIYSVGLV